MSKPKRIVGFDCEASAVLGIKLLLHTRLEEMCGLRTGALDWSDIEGVHDMRVASRRLRSALRDFKPYFKRRKQRRAGDAIKRIADSLGTVRDKDVAIAALEKLAANAPPDVAVGIEMFAAERRGHREADRRALVDALASEQLVSIRAEFDATLEVALVSTQAGRSKVADGQPELSFRSLGQNIVKSRMEELQDYRTSLYHPLTTKPLHRMRIAAKRLRYAIELFAQCWNTRLDAFAKEVAELQTSLGELHDSDVWIAEFGGLLEKQNESDAGTEPTETGDVNVQRYHACVWLLGHFTKRRTNHYRDALARWHDWETNDFFARLETCMQRSPTKRKASQTSLSIVKTIASDVDSSRVS